MSHITPISHNSYLGESPLEKSTIANKVVSYTQKALSAGQTQKVIPAITSALSNEVSKSIGKSLFIAGGVLGCVVYGLSLLQKNRFIDGLRCLKINQFPNKKQKEAFIELIKKPGNLEKILSPEFCKKNNIHSGLFLNENKLRKISEKKLDLMLEQAKKKRIIDSIGLIISLLSLTVFLASMATPVPIWVIQFLPTILFAVNYIVEKQFIDNTFMSIDHFIPDFIKNFSNQKKLLKINDLSSIFEDNRARIGLYLTEREGKELDEKMRTIKKIRELSDNALASANYQNAKEEFSERLRQILQAKIKQSTAEMVGFGFLGAGGGLSLTSPAFLPLVLPLLAIGFVLAFAPSWVCSLPTKPRDDLEADLSQQKASDAFMGSISQL